MDVRVGLWRRPSAEELMLLNCGVGEDSWDPLDCKEILKDLQPVHPKGDQSWVFTGRTDVEAETPIVWPPHAKSWHIGKDPDAGRDWGQEEKERTEDKMARWHHRPDAHEFGWTPGVGDGQGGLECWNSWGHKELDTTEWLNWTVSNRLKKHLLYWIYILWSLDAKSQPTGKDPDAGKDWRQEGKGVTEDEVVGWHYRLNGHDSEQIPGDSKGQGSLACCSP